MADEVEKQPAMGEGSEAAMAAPEKKEAPAPTPAPEAPGVEMTSLPKAELEKMRQALKDANAEQLKNRKRIQEIEAAEQAKKDADLSEMEKLQKQLERDQQQINELSAQLAARQLLDLKNTVAKKVGLPDGLAARLVGTDEESLTEDAKNLLSSLPKPAPAETPKKQPGVTPPNPGPNGAQGITDIQKFAQIMSSQNVAFDVNHARRRGGGVVYTGPTEPKE